MDGVSQDISGAVDQAGDEAEGAEGEAKEWIEQAQDEADRAAQEPADLENKPY